MKDTSPDPRGRFLIRQTVGERRSFVKDVRPRRFARFHTRQSAERHIDYLRKWGPTTTYEVVER